MITNDLQRLALKFLGVCAVILISAVAYGAVVNNSIDVSASTLAGAAMGALGGFLTNSATHPPPPGGTRTTQESTAPAIPPDVTVTKHENESNASLQ